MSEKGQTTASSKSRPFWKVFARVNFLGLVILIVSDLTIAYVTLKYSGILALDQGTILFSSGIALLAILTATMAFFGTQVEKYIDQLSKIQKALGHRSRLIREDDP